MKLLLHTCCAPCLLYPLAKLKDKGFTVTGYFYNPNIHPYKEFKRRLDSLLELSQTDDISVVLEREYELDRYLEAVVFNKESRCSICYDIRLEKTVEYAKSHGFEAFSTTLLYSRYQKHDLIKEKCQALARQFNIDFLYDDFREGWQQGIDSSISKGLYRQPYCGCIYSERERYDNRLKKLLAKKRKQEK